ncbi:NADP-dependent oxidoreductase [Gryllotalpicola protaetiae]|uniref:NADP-dependent oxidoreductase n=1 Tax=Gryllotalpicola protaetiae TaxID=2419771 RepID=A0A387BRX6_9MICO|nr:NADP-dependent oxidoreductase [Gryllotalpicola protaetiae]AYG05458.1 NADP-dependent oxidoreductase [Gryllotalpicola protaetiae]
MKAVQIRSFGGIDVLELREVDVPHPGPGQLRIRVEAAAVNPVDIQTRSGALAQACVMLPRPHIGLGWDVAGVVDHVGAGGRSDLTVGDRVIALSDRLMQPLKGQADFVVVDSSHAARIPIDADPVALSTLPLSGLTALQALDYADMAPGQTLLVTGAAGSVGGYVLQLAQRIGLQVIATARAHDETLVRALGAHEFVPSNEDLAEETRRLTSGGADAVVDAASLGLAALDAVRGSGTFISLSGPGPIPLRGTQVRSVWIRADGGQLARLVDADLTHRVAGTHPLEHVGAVHERMQVGGERGRHVLLP